MWRTQSLLFPLLQRFHEAVGCYDAGLLDFRDPATVKLRNQAEERAKELDELAYQDPEKAEAAKNEGNEFFKQENWGDAVRCYSEAIRRNPKSAVYYSNRSVAYIKLREYGLALTDAEKCVSLDPSFVKGWVRKGMAHHMQKEYYKALEAYEKGMKIDPNYPELVEWTEKTTQAIQRMHTSGGKEEAEAARQRALSDPEIQQLLKDGEVQNLLRTLQSGNRKGAEEMLQKSQTLFTKYGKLSQVRKRWFACGCSPPLTTITGGPDLKPKMHAHDFLFFLHGHERLKGAIGVRGATECRTTQRRRTRAGASRSPFATHPRARLTRARARRL